MRYVRQLLTNGNDVTRQHEDKHTNENRYDDNEISFELFKAVKKLMKAECRISRGWHIGKEAEDLYGRLRFICIGLNEPESFDFKIIEQ